MSCDLLESETPGLHWRGDVSEILGLGWDLLIAHPPCTPPTVSGARHFEGKEFSGVHSKQDAFAALAFVRLLLEAPVPRICLENPVSIISSAIRKPDQVIQPWQFGQPARPKPHACWLGVCPN